MEIVAEFLKNISLWEITLLIIVVYIFFRPDLIDRITKLKIGNVEVALSELKKEVAKGNEKISELESEIEYEKRQFEELLEGFSADAPLNKLSALRQSIKAQARNVSEDEIFQKNLNTSASPEELYATAVAIREKRPINLLPDLISLMDELSKDDNLGGYRLNTIWMLTSGIHKILISAVRDGVKPFPTKKLLDKCELVLKRLDKNPKVEFDRPDNPMRGIKGPIKYSLDWIEKARKELK